MEVQGMCLSDKWHRESSPEIPKRRGKSKFDKSEPKKELPDSFLPKSPQNGEKNREEESPPQDIDPSGDFSPH